jgi:hypothetical protein
VALRRMQKNFLQNLHVVVPSVPTHPPIIHNCSRLLQMSYVFTGSSVDFVLLMLVLMLRISALYD